jgi:hypothetical protein
LQQRAADFAANLLGWGLRAGGPDAYRNVVNALWERQPHYAQSQIQLVLPDRVTPAESERPVVQRIFDAYQKMKQAQLQADPIFLPGGGWKNVIENAYGELLAGSRENNIERFHYFLANFAAWEIPTGIDESSAYRKLAESDRKRRHFEQQVVAQLLHWWQTLESEGRSLDELVMPPYGNQGGFQVGSLIVTPNGIYGDFYARLLAGFLRSQPQPHARRRIAELGGGFGRLYYFLSKQLTDTCYLDFDLPELLCCAAYYLMLCFPDKRFLLYGEADYSADCFDDFDVLLLPSFEIERTPTDAVDLFINENSLGVMPPVAARRFVDQMCRVSEAIWHRNHETRRNPFPDNETSLLNREYPIDLNRFQLVARHCDIERVIGHAMALDKNDMYWYYYRRS